MEERFGFIHDNIDIKILILFIMRRLSAPVAIEALTELTLCDGGIGYFDFTDCVSQLTDTGHLIFDGETYTLTEKGSRNGEATENLVPYTVRVKAEKAASLRRVELARNAMIKTTTTARKDIGFDVSLRLSDGLGDIVSINLFAASEQQSSELEKGFRENAEDIYNKLLELILGSH